jgi:hypothetical protein
LLHGTIHKHGQQIKTVRLRNAGINVDPRFAKAKLCRISSQSLASSRSA